MDNLGFVYMITSPSNRIYVGSTININRRWEDYKYLMCKSQPKLYRSLIKYGVENHIFEIVWSGNIKDMLKYESMIGTYYNVINSGLNCMLPKINDLYNTTSDLTRKKMKNAKLGTKISEHTKNALIKSNLGKRKPYKSRPLSPEQREKHIIRMTKNNPMKIYKHSYEVLIKGVEKRFEKIIQYDMNGNFIKEWNSSKEAAKFYNKNPTCISHCIRGKVKSSIGFIWKKKN
jgi:group I intron endonuclease